MTEGPPHPKPLTSTEQRDRVTNRTNILLTHIQDDIKRFTRNAEAKLRSYQSHLRLPEADLDEIANSALLSLSEKITQYDTETVERFARTCVRNAVIDHLRKKKVRQTDELQIQPTHEPETIAIAATEYDSFYATITELSDSLTKPDHKLLLACRVRYLLNAPGGTATAYVSAELNWPPHKQKDRRAALEAFWEATNPSSYALYYHRLFPQQNAEQP